MKLGAWSELLRVSALFTVPGDVLAGAAAAGARPRAGTACAIGASLCLYEAGMTLNDWADRAEDAVDRPHRPIPSGRVSSAAALTAGSALTVAGLVLASRAGRPALAVATALAGTVWAYDLRLKHTPAGPAAMAAARSLDLLLGAAAGGGLRGAWVPAALLGAHTYAVTTVSRHEVRGGSTAAPLAALAGTAVLGALAARTRRLPPRPVAGGADMSDGSSRVGARPKRPYRSMGRTPGTGPRGSAGRRPGHQVLTPAGPAVAAYLATAAGPYLHAALNPSPPLTQRAVGGGIRAMIPLQAALAAGAGAHRTAAALLALGPLARGLARKVSPT